MRGAWPDEPVRRALPTPLHGTRKADWVLIPSPTSSPSQGGPSGSNHFDDTYEVQLAEDDWKEGNEDNPSYGEQDYDPMVHGPFSS